MLKNDDVIDSLNGLIEISKDEEEFFKHAIENLTDPRLKEFLKSRVINLAESVVELQILVRSVGGIPTPSASLASLLQKKWTDLKAALSSNDNLTILNEVVSAEENTVRSYLNFLDSSVPIEAEIVVSRLYETARQNMEYVSHLQIILETENILV